MPIAWWGLVGLFAAALVNRAADCWLSPARLQCGLTRSPVRVWLVGISLPALFAILASASFAQPRELAIVCLYTAILALLSVVDWEQRRVPNVVVLPGIVLALLHAWAVGRFELVAVGALLSTATFFTLYLLGRRLYGPGALGMGDVKLAGLVGAFVGLPWVPHALLMGILLAGGASLAALLAGRARPQDSLPFGHYLALGAIVVLVGSAWIG